MTDRTGLLTDRYELTMLDSWVRDGSAGHSAVFEVFARRLPEGRRYGVLAGLGRLLPLIESFTFDRRRGRLARRSRAWSASRARRTCGTSGSAATSTPIPRATSTSPAARC